MSSIVVILDSFYGVKSCVLLREYYNIIIGLILNLLTLALTLLIVVAEQNVRVNLTCYENLLFAANSFLPEARTVDEFSLI